MSDSGYTEIYGAKSGPVIGRVLLREQGDGNSKHRLVIETPAGQGAEFWDVCFPAIIWVAQRLAGWLQRILLDEDEPLRTEVWVTGSPNAKATTEAAGREEGAPATESPEQKRDNGASIAPSSDRAINDDQSEWPIVAPLVEAVSLGFADMQQRGLNLEEILSKLNKVASESSTTQSTMVAVVKKLASDAALALGRLDADRGERIRDLIHIADRFSTELDELSKGKSCQWMADMIRMRRADFQEIESAIGAFGVERYTCQGEQFDSTFQNAVEVATKDSALAGKVSERMRAGWRVRGGKPVRKELVGVWTLTIEEGKTNAGI